MCSVILAHLVAAGAGDLGADDTGASVPEGAAGITFSSSDDEYGEFDDEEDDEDDEGDSDASSDDSQSLSEGRDRAAPRAASSGRVTRKSGVKGAASPGAPGGASKPTLTEIIPPEAEDAPIWCGRGGGKLRADARVSPRRGPNGEGAPVLTAASSVSPLHRRKRTRAHLPLTKYQLEDLETLLPARSPLPPPPSALQIPLPVDLEPCSARRSSRSPAAACLAPGSHIPLSNLLCGAVLTACNAPHSIRPATSWSSKTRTRWTTRSSSAACSWTPRT